MGFKILTVAFAVFAVAAFVYGDDDQETITQTCLGCICDAASGCNTTIGCTLDVCGPFRITKSYWSDGGKPSIDGGFDADDSAYKACANDARCASRAVQGYMEKYSQDCDGDGTIDCNDYARLHHLGGYGCSGAMDDFYEQTFTYCHKIFEQS